MSVVTAGTRDRTSRNVRTSGKARFWDREAPLAYLFMIPGLVILVLFMAYPFFLGIYLSLTDKRVGFASFDIVGLDNFRRLLNDAVFRRTVANTLIYSFVTVPFKLLLGLGLALVLNQTFRFSRFVRAGLLLPWIVPTAISSLAWLMLFDPSSAPSPGCSRSGVSSRPISISWGIAGTPSPPSAWPTSGEDCPSSPSRFSPVCRPSPRSYTKRRHWMARVPGNVLFGDVADDPGHRPHHHALLDHLHLFRFPTDLRPHQRRAGELDACLWHLRLSDDDLPSRAAAAISISMFPFLALFAAILLRYIRADD